MRRSFEEILKYREVSRERMKAFHVFVREIRAEIESSPWTVAFESEIRRILDKKIRPAETGAAPIGTGRARAIPDESAGRTFCV